MSSENSTPIRFIGAGSFGCTFKPSIPCLTERANFSGPVYLSKVVNIEKYSNDAEVRIGEMITRIPDFESYFAPILQVCVMDSSFLLPDVIEQCSMMAASTDLSLFVSNLMRYVGTDSLRMYLYEQTTKSVTLGIQATFKTHYHLLRALTSLQTLSNPIVHFDLKENNVLLDDTTGSPIVIDFGFSFTKEKLMLTTRDKNVLNELFWSYDGVASGQANDWCLEVDLLSYISQIPFKHHNVEYSSIIGGTDIRGLENTVDRYITKMEFTNSGIFPLEEVETFRDAHKKNLGRFLNYTWGQLIEYLISTWSSWDNFSLSLIYCTFFGRKQRVHNRLNIFGDSELNWIVTPQTNPLMLKYTDMITKTVLAHPGNLQDPIKTMKNLVALLV